MFGTVLIYGGIFVVLRTRSRSQTLSRQAVHGAMPLMILYPLIYVVCTAPLAIGRIAGLAGKDISLGFFCVAGSMIACNGWLDVLLYTSTRADIVFAAYPPTENIGLDTFAFLGKGHKFGTTTTVEAGERGGSRLGGVRRSHSGDSLEHLYGLDQIRIKGEVTVSVNDGGSEIPKNRREAENKWDGTSRKSSQTLG